MSAVLTRSATPLPLPLPLPLPVLPAVTRVSRSARGCVRVNPRCSPRCPLTRRHMCTAAPFTYISAFQSIRVCCANRSFSPFFAAPWPPGPRLCLGRARRKDRKMPCVMTRHAALCAGNLKMRQRRGADAGKEGRLLWATGSISCWLNSSNGETQMPPVGGITFV